MDGVRVARTRCRADNVTAIGAFVPGPNGPPTLSETITIMALTQQRMAAVIEAALAYRNGMAQLVNSIHTIIAQANAGKLAYTEALSIIADFALSAPISMAQHDLIIQSENLHIKHTRRKNEYEARRRARAKGQGSMVAPIKSAMLGVRLAPNYQPGLAARLAAELDREEAEGADAGEPSPTLIDLPALAPFPTLPPPLYPQPDHAKLEQKLYGPLGRKPPHMSQADYDHIRADLARELAQEAEQDGEEA